MGVGRLLRWKTGFAVFVVLLAIGGNYYRKQKTLSPVLEITTGKLQGIVSYTRDRKEVHEYLKVPFAKPPIGDLRFEPPQPVESWMGIHDSTEFGPNCMQAGFLFSTVDGSEDCLYLNVYTPAERKGLLPVMVWLHGGAFLQGAASRYRPAYLLDENVILVTPSYRLAAFGFLNTGDGSVRGNMGLKDQTMALKWVQENIEYFGGDPKKITLFGESAGGVSVGYHLISPMSKGLFVRAIQQSGSPLADWAFNRKPQNQAEELISKVNCTRNNMKEAVSCLKELDGGTLVVAFREMLTNIRDSSTLFVPTVETVVDGNTFLSKEPIEVLKSGEINKVPLIIGMNEDEGLLASAIITANQTKLRQANEEWNYYAPRVLGFDPDRMDVSQRLRQYYFGEDANEISSANLLQNYTNIFSDRHFFIPTHKFGKEFAKHVPVRMYLYGYSAQFSFSDILPITQSERLPIVAAFIWELTKRWTYKRIGRELDHLGVCHGDEIQLLFNFPIRNFIGEDEKDTVMSKLMTSLWTDFAKDRKVLSINGVEWPVIQSKGNVVSLPLQYLSLSMNPRMINEPFADRVELWDSLGV